MPSRRQLLILRLPPSGGSPTQVALYQQCTGRETPPTTPAREAWAIRRPPWWQEPRRGPARRVDGSIARLAPIPRPWRAGDRRRHRCGRPASARRLPLRLRSHRAVPMLTRMVTRRTVTSVELGHIVIEVHTYSYRSTRGHSFAAIIADEVACWRHVPPLRHHRRDGCRRCVRCVPRHGIQGPARRQHDRTEARPCLTTS